MSTREVFIDLQQSHFVQPVADHGYYWDDAAQPNPDGPPFLVTTREKPCRAGPFLIESPGTAGYRLLELRAAADYRQQEEALAPTLFLEFASVEPTREGILGFANRYGKLSLSGEIEVLTPVYSWPAGEAPRPPRGPGSVIYPNRSDGRDYLGVFGESLQWWQDEIRDMRRVTALWQWLREENVGCLSQVIKWRGDSVLYMFANPEDVQRGETRNAESGLLAAPWFRGDILARFRRGDYLLPAQHLLQTKINEKLRLYHTKPRLLMNEKNQLEPYLYPDGLIAALWFQCYQAVVGEKKLKRCSICGKWQDVTDLTPRRQEKWQFHSNCATRERVRRYRERKREKTRKEEGHNGG